MLLGMQLPNLMAMLLLLASSWSAGKDVARLVHVFHTRGSYTTEMRLRHHR
jgi:hypothetical protein